MSSSHPEEVISLRFAAVSTSPPGLVRRLRSAGHAVAIHPAVQPSLLRDPGLDAILLGTGAGARLPSWPLATDLAGGPCIVLLLAHGEWPGTQDASVLLREFLAADPDEMELQALLCRLAWRRRARTALAAQARQRELLDGEPAAARKRSMVLHYRISHAVQAVLRYIGRFAEQLEQTAGPKLDSTEAGHLRFIRQSAQDAHLEVQDLVTLAELEQAQPEPVSLDLERLVASCIDDLGSEGAHVQWRSVRPFPRVAADPGLLRLALEHLLANAAESTHGRGPARVEVRALSVADGTRIEVEDNGIGFDAAEARRLFQPHGKLHPRELFKGRGMGLAFVRAVAERHGGTVAAAARAQGGAVFSLWLPRAGAEPLAQPQGAQAQPRESLRVLVVDDDELVLTTLRHMVVRLGHAAWTAPSGESALASLDFLDIDVLLVDWALPGLDGLRVAAETRRRHPGTATVVMTGEWGVGERQFAAEDGVDHVLAKPVSLGALREALRAVGAAARGRAQATQ